MVDSFDSARRDLDLVLGAAEFAMKAHYGQRRKYTNAPYITHPLRVAARVSEHPMSNPRLVAAAYLHDVVEDCGVTIDQIIAEFGGEVAMFVEMLTNRPKEPGLNRAARKAKDRERLKGMASGAKLIKLIDRIDNLREMDRSSDFAKVYAEESLLLLEVLRGIDAELELELEGLAKGLRDGSAELGGGGELVSDSP